MEAAPGDPWSFGAASKASRCPTSHQNLGSGEAHERPAIWKQRTNGRSRLASQDGIATNSTNLVHFESSDGASDLKRLLDFRVIGQRDDSIMRYVLISVRARIQGLRCGQYRRCLATTARLSLVSLVRKLDDVRDRRHFVFNSDFGEAGGGLCVQAWAKMKRRQVWSLGER